MLITGKYDYLFDSSPSSSPGIVLIPLSLKGTIWRNFKWSNIYKIIFWTFNIDEEIVVFFFFKLDFLSLLPKFTSLFSRKRAIKNVQLYCWSCEAGTCNSKSNTQILTVVLHVKGSVYEKIRYTDTNAPNWNPHLQLWYLNN